MAQSAFAVAVASSYVLCFSRVFYAMPSWYQTSDEFRALDDEGNFYVCQWEFEPNKPVQRKSGVSGWANVNGDKAKRLHVCFHNPCIAKHSKSKYGHMPEPLHVRLVDEQAAGVALPASSSAAGPSLTPSLPGVALEAPVAAGPDVAVAAGTGVVAEPPEVSAAACCDSSSSSSFPSSASFSSSSYFSFSAMRHLW